jgi:ribose 5-phosphate isomerase B
MKIYIASDHAAYLEKNKLVEFLSRRFDVIDLGTHSAESTHYPDWVKKLVERVKAEHVPGILLCGSGIGVSMAANRYRDIRAALCRDEDDARMGRLHNNANVLCLSGRKTPQDLINRIADVFLSTPFEGGRHQTRVDLFNNLGE